MKIIFIHNNYTNLHAALNDWYKTGNMSVKHILDMYFFLKFPVHQNLVEYKWIHIQITHSLEVIYTN